jgi:hypothetical protein
MESTLNLLPTRKYLAEQSFKNYTKSNFITNFYDIRLAEKYSVFYQYTFETTPEIPLDSKELLYQIIRHAKKQLVDKIDLITISGKMAWGLVKQNMAFEVTS